MTKREMTKRGLTKREMTKREMTQREVTKRGLAQRETTIGRRDFRYLHFFGDVAAHDACRFEQ